MSSVIGFKQPNATTASRRAAALAEVTGSVQPTMGVAPWKGWTPDIDVAHLGPSAAKSISGLIPRADPGGRGEGLFHFPGFDHIDSTYASSTALGADADTTNYIVGLDFISRRDGNGDETGEWKDTTIAVGRTPGAANCGASFHPLACGRRCRSRARRRCLAGIPRRASPTWPNYSTWQLSRSALPRGQD